jgi:hypothetical protein
VSDPEITTALRIERGCSMGARSLALYKAVRQRQSTLVNTLLYFTLLRVFSYHPATVEGQHPTSAAQVRMAFHISKARVPILFLVPIAADMAGA